MDIEELKYEVELYRELAREKYKKLRKAQDVVNTIKNTYEFYKDRFEDLDRQLAMVDGRYTVHEEHEKKPKAPKVEDFTIDEVRELAKKLGVEISV